MKIQLMKVFLILLMIGMTACETTDKGSVSPIHSFSEYTVTQTQITPAQEIDWPTAKLLKVEGSQYMAFGVFEAPQLIQAMKLSKLQYKQNGLLLDLVEEKDKEIYQLHKAGLTLEKNYELALNELDDALDSDKLSKWMVYGLLGVTVVGSVAK